MRSLEAARAASIRNSKFEIRKSAFTLIELLLALAITAMIGAAVAGMMFGVSRGTADAREMRELAIKSKAVCARVGAAIRNASLVLAAGDDHLVLWVYDLDADGTPSPRELQRLDYDAAADTLTSYEPADTAADENETEYALDDDFLDATDDLIAAEDLVGSVWARRVTGLDLTLNDADEQSATLVGLRLTLEAGDLSDVAVTAVALRNAP